MTANRSSDGVLRVYARSRLTVDGGDIDSTMRSRGVPFDEVAAHLAQAHIGVVTFLPVPIHVEASDLLE